MWRMALLIALLAGQGARRAVATPPRPAQIECPTNVVEVTDSSVPLDAAPGSTYRLGPGAFTLARRVLVEKQESVCFTGAGAAATVLLPPPPRTADSVNSHINQQGGDVSLSGLTLSCGGASATAAALIGGSIAPGEGGDTGPESYSMTFALRSVVVTGCTQTAITCRFVSALLSFADTTFANNSNVNDDGSLAGRGVSGGALLTTCDSQFHGATAFRGNTAFFSGGAIAYVPDIRNNSRLARSDFFGPVVFERNRVLLLPGAGPPGGGAAWLTRVAFTTHDAATFTGNSAGRRGGSGGAVALAPLATLMHEGTVAYVRNAAGEAGGAVAVGDGASLVFAGPAACVQLNRAGARGGALFVGGAAAGARVAVAAGAEATFGPNTVEASPGGGGGGDLDLWVEGALSSVACAGQPALGQGVYAVEGALCGAACVAGGGNCSCAAAGLAWSRAQCACAQVPIEITSFTAAPSSVAAGQPVVLTAVVAPNGAGAAVSFRLSPPSSSLVARCSPGLSVPADAAGVATTTCTFSAPGEYAATATAVKDGQRATAELDGRISVCSNSLAGPFLADCKGCSYDCVTSQLTCALCKCPPPEPPPPLPWGPPPPCKWLLSARLRTRHLSCGCWEQHPTNPSLPVVAFCPYGRPFDVASCPPGWQVGFDVAAQQMRCVPP